VLQDHKNVRYRIGDGEAVPALELCLRYMKMGEESDLYSAPTMAWSEQGLKAVGDSERPVPPNNEVYFRVVLHEIIPEPTAEDWNFRIQEAAWRKAHGNDYFQRGDFARAMQCYKWGLKVFDSDIRPPDHIEDQDAAVAAAATIAVDCGSNLAAVQLQLKDIIAARETTKLTLAMNPMHVKANYRAAKAYLALDEFDECEAALKRALEVEPENASVKRLFLELKRKQIGYEAKMRKVREKMFQDVRYPDSAKTAEAAAASAAAPAPESRQQTAVIAWLWAQRGYLVPAICGLVLLLISMLVLPRRLKGIAIIVGVIGTPISMAVAVTYIEWKDETRSKAIEKRD